MRSPLLLSLLLSILFFHSSFARTIRVPADSTTIQAAITDAEDGDTVLVAPGTYTGEGNKDIELLGKAVVVMSEAGAEQTIIDCEGSGRGFYIHQGEQRSTVIKGFTIRNAGTGILVDARESPIIENCTIEDASSRGIQLNSYSDAIIQNCIIRQCSSYGLYLNRAQDALIQNCLIYDNGNIGIYINFGDSPPIISCTIYGNSDAGVHCDDGTLYMRNCIVWNNTADEASLNIYSTKSAVGYSNIEGGFPGKGNQDALPLFIDADSGDFHLQQDSPCIDAGHPEDKYNEEPAPNGNRINLGFYGNTSEAAIGDNDKPIILSVEPDSGSIAGGTAITIRGSNFGDSPGSLKVGDKPVEVLFWASNQVIGKVAPNPAGRSAIELASSAGKADLLAEGFTYKGAKTLKVPSEFSTIQKAITFAQDGDKVLVAPGTYSGPGNQDIDLLGKAITVMSEAGPEQTIIDCGGSGRGFYIHHNEQEHTLISGFTIRNAHTGILLDPGESPIIIQCIVEDISNQGIRLSSGNDAIVRNCIIRRCGSYGLYAYRADDAIIQNSLIYRNENSGIYSGGEQSPQIINCTIFGNSADKGGGIYCFSGQLNMRNSIVWGNIAEEANPNIYGLERAITYSNVEGGLPGKGNLDENPRFIDPANGDFHLQAGSPCIDAGSPADAFDQEPAPNGDRINQGYYGNTGEAATGENGLPVIASVQPAQGPAAGGNTIIIQGSNFGGTPGSLSIGGQAVEVLRWEPKRLVGRVAAAQPGAADLELINASGKTTLLTGGYTYLGPSILRVPSEFATIQKAVNFAKDGDKVLVAPGTYTGLGNKNIALLGKAIELVSEAGPEATVIDCQGSGRGFFIHQGEQRSTVVKGFTVRDASTGILVDYYESPIIEDCIIEDASSSGLRMNNYSKAIIRNCIVRRCGSYGLYLFRVHEASIRNCLVYDNDDIGIYVTGASSPPILNCTILGNSEGGVSCPNGQLNMRNCIVWGNLPPQIDANTSDVTYSNVGGGWPGEGNIDTNPLFIGLNSGDFHLAGSSPCIDAGDPRDDFQNEPLPNGGRINMGYYGNTAQAATGSSAVPMITMIYPAQGTASGGVIDTLAGTNFGAGTGEVYFGDSTANILSWENEMIICQVSPHPEGAVDVKIITAATRRAAVLEDGFTFTERLPLRVPQDYATIQEAIDSARAGDIVEVAPGTYTGSGNKDLELKGKAVTVRSTAGAIHTIIDCEGSGTGFTFKSDDDRDALVKGFTIRNSGYSGIFVDNWASPVIDSCILEDHPENGIYLDYSSKPLIRYCSIRNNQRGIYSRTSSSDAVIQNCIISGNASFEDGGGMLSDVSTSPLLLNCTITQNSAAGRGGGVYGEGKINMRNCILWANTAESYPALFSKGNTVSYSCIEGGWPGEGNIDAGPLFVQPDSSDFHLQASSPCIDAGAPNDELAAEPSPNGHRINMGAYGNTPEAAASVAGKPVLFSVFPTNGPPEGGGFCLVSGKNLGNANGNILFGDNPAPIISWTDTLTVCEVPAHPAGRVNVNLSTTDGGSNELPSAYTYSGTVVHHVPDQYATIQQAIDLASEGDTVLVAPGIYTGQGNKELELRGKAIVVASEEGAAQTIIDCEEDGRGFFIHENERRNTVISGFTIRNSNSDGIFLDYGEDPTIQYCILENNAENGMYWDHLNAPLVQYSTFRNNGRGIYTSNAKPEGVIKSCLITENRSSENGAGIFNSYRSPLLLNCTITKNSSSAEGGGVFGNELNMRNCIVWDNTASSYPNISSGEHEISYSCIEGGWPGTGNIQTDPAFTDPEAGDFHLRATSPCLDAGDPNDDFRKEPNHNGSRINIGAYGNTSEATTSDPSRPALLSITPHEGPPSGGNACMITGQDFGDTVGSISFDGTEVTTTLWSDTLIICTVPPHPSGKVNIELTTTEGRNDELISAYTYTGPAIHKVPEEYATIQRAIDFASEGDTVLVASGIYTGPGNKDLELRGKAIVVRSKEGAGQTIIDCEGNGKGAYFRSSVDRNTVFLGFTIRNSDSDGIYLEGGASPTIEFCTLDNNSDNGMYWYNDNAPFVQYCSFLNNGRGIHTRYVEPEAVLKNCVFAKNTTSGRGGGIFISGPSPLLLNCTIAQNRSAQEGGGIYANQLNMRNCIVWGNKASTDSTANIVAEEANITYSNVEGGWPGTGNIDQHPVFANHLQTDYRLHPSSPCIDAGDPADGYSQEPSPDGGRINMGAYGNTTEAASFAIQPAIISHQVAPSCGETTTVELKGFNLGTEGTISLGEQSILADNIQSWTDTLIRFTAPTDGIEGADILVNTDLGSDGISGAYLITPRVQYVSDTVSGIWTAECPGTYVLTGDVIVPEDSRLTIEPGVKVLVDAESAVFGATFLVEGTLIARGTETDSILFSTLTHQEAPGAWEGLDLDMQDNSEAAYLSHCIIENARIGITAQDSDVTIEYCSIRDNSETGVLFYANRRFSSGRLQYSEVSNNWGFGVHTRAIGGSRSAYGDPRIFKNTIENNFQGGIFVESQAFTPFYGPPSRSSRAVPEIISNNIRNNSGYGIECLADGDWTAGSPGNFFYRAYASPTLEGNIVSNNAGGFYAYTEPTGGGTWLSYSEPRVINNTFYNNGTIAILAGDSAKITIINSVFWGELPARIDNNGGQTSISYSNLQLSESDPGNLSTPPQFFDSANNDFRLLASSPGIDAGINEAVSESRDFAGALRIVDGDGDGQAMVDMGALEYYLPQLNTQPPSSIETCAGEEITLSIEASGEHLSYQWQKDGQNIPQSNAPQLAISETQPEDSGAYRCQVTDELGGTVQSEVAQLTVHPFFDVDVQIEASASSICQGEEALLTATPSDAGANPTYQWQLNGEETGANSPSLELSDLEPGTYTAQCLLTSQEECTANNPATSDEITIEVHALPVITLASPGPVCTDAEPFELDIATPAGGGYSGTGISNGQFDPQAAGPGDHNISYTFTNPETGCSQTESTTIAVEAVEEVGIEITASASSICMGELVTVTANTTHAGTNPTYQWILNGEPTGSNGPALSISALGPGTHQVKCILTSQETCTSNNPATSNVVTIVVHPLPEVMMESPEPVCANAEPFELDIAGPAGGEYSGTGVSNGRFDPAAAGPGEHTISYTYTDPQTGCSQTESTTVTVEAVEEVDVDIAASTNSICPGEVVTFTANTANAGANPTYQWTRNGEPTGGNSPALSLSGLSPDIYQIQCTLTAQEECTSNNPAMSNEVSIVMHPLPEVTLELPDSIFAAMGLVELTGGMPIGGIYEGAGVVQSGSSFFFDPAAVGQGSQPISYTYTDENGCTASATAEILVGLEGPARKFGLKVFPNPSSGRFTLRAEGLSGTWAIIVFNLMGQSIREEAWEQPSKGEKTLNLSDVPKGTYLLKMTNERQRFIKKITIQ